MKLSRFIASALMSVMAIAIPVTAYAGYYPTDRPTYQCITPQNCPGADHVQFNSFTNNPTVGDERPFLAGSINSQPVQDRIQVKDGDRIVVRAYVHNNADMTKMGNNEANTVAKNVRIAVQVPTGEQTDTNIVGFISADNASPRSINDTMSVYAGSAFTLQYVNGSAEFTHKPDGVNEVTTQLSDSIITQSGASLGDINGCFAYSGFVYLTVVVHMNTVTPPKPVYNCTVFTVIGDNNSRKVTVKDFKTVQANGATFKNAVIDWGQKGSKNTTTTNPIGQTFTYDDYGTYTITATAHFTVNGEDKTDSTGCVQKVTFTKPKTPTTPTTPVTPVTPPTQLPNTGAGSVIGIAAAAMVAGTIGYRLLLSRRLARKS